MLARTISTAVPRPHLHALVSAYLRETECQSLQELLQTNPSEEELKIAFVAEVNQAIRGTALHALIINTVIFFTSALANVAISPAVNSMIRLSGPLKNVLVSTPALAASVLMIPVGNRFDSTGGKKELIALRSVAILGLLGLTTLSAFTDLTEVDSFEYRYGIMLALNAMVGATLPSFLSVTNIIHWTPIASIGHASAMYGGIGNIAPGLFLLTLQLALDKIGLPLSFGVSASALALGTLAMVKYFVESPYHQLRNKNLSHEEAVAIASMVNQERFPLSPDIDTNQMMRESLKDLRVLTLSAASSSYGIFIASTISLYITLVEILGITPTQAVLTTAAGSMWSTLVRMGTGKLIDKYDASGGVHTYCLSSALTAAGALMMAIPKPLPSFAYTAVAQGLIFTGTGSGALSSLLLTPLWADPQNGYSKPYNNGAVGGILATVGTLWGMLLPLSTALFVLGQKEEGYQNAFYLTAAIALISSAMTLLTQQHLKMPLQTSAARCWAGMFNQPQEDRASIGPVALESGDKRCQTLRF